MVNTAWTHMLVVWLHRYTLGLALQEGGDMRADIALASGVVFPQNAPAPQLQLTYAPRYQGVVLG